MVTGVQTCALPISIGVVTLVLFAVLGVHDSDIRLALIYALFPICPGLFVSNSMTNGLRSLPDDLQTDGNAAFNTIRQLGGASGTAVVIAIVNAAEAADPVAGTATGTQLSFHGALTVGGADICQPYISIASVL